MTRSAARPRCALLLALALLAACGGGGTPAPQLVFFFETASPAPDAFFVPLDQVVTLTFNKAVDPATVQANTLTVTAAGTGALNGTTALVPDGTGRSLRWTPSALFAEDTLHTVRILAALRSVDGEPVDGPDAYSFRTIPSGAPPFLPNPNQLRSTTGDLNLGRQSHCATLLADGRVLVTGGFRQESDTTDRAEVFSPNTELFTELNDRMQSERASHTATRLADGRVLICGGLVQPMPGGNLVTTASAELFNPGTNTFSPLPDMTEQRAFHAALLRPDGTVLITGGSRLDGGFLTDFDDAEVFDPGTLSFSPHPMTMIHTRSSHGMVDMGNGKFVLSGGSDTDLRSEWYDVVSDTFESIGQGANEQIRFGPAMAAFTSGDVIVAGGDLVGTVMHIFADSGLVQNTGSGLNRARSFATASRVADDQILVAGGTDFARGGFIEASVDLIVEGGLGGSRTFGTDVRFPHGMSGHTATTLDNGEILFVGGLNVDGTQPNLRDAFIFELTPP